MPTQLLSLPRLSRAILCMIWTCKKGTRSHLSHLGVKAYPHSLRRAIPALISTSLGGFWLDSGLKLLSSYLSNILGANQHPNSWRRPKVLSRTSGRTAAPTKVSICWGCTWYGADWSKMKTAELFANSSLKMAPRWSIKRQCLMSSHWCINPSGAVHGTAIPVILSQDLKNCKKDEPYFEHWKWGSVIIGSEKRVHIQDLNNLNLIYGFTTYI